MLLHRNILLLTFAITALLHLNIALSKTYPDMQESRDHPKIPRVAGTSIVGYAASNYDEGVFMTGALDRELLSEEIEGKRTRIMYVGPKDLSPLGVLRNYQKGFADLGEVEEIYTCKGNDCFRNLFDSFIWRKSNRLPNNLGKKADKLDSFVGFKDQIYWHGKVRNAESLYHISIYTAISSWEKTWSRHTIERMQNNPLIYLEIVEITDFKPTLEVVKAEDMTTKISEKGHITIYGINFDFDSDMLKPGSDPTLEEIAKALNTDTTLNIYVVGHTDNKGTLEYNQDLSKRRAGSVVKILSSKYGIANERMIPIGSGPTSPLATNKTEEGQALNRRVELVER